MQEYRERQLDTEYHLRNNQSFKRISDKENQQQGNSQRQEHAYLRVTVLDMIPAKIEPAAIPLVIVDEMPAISKASANTIAALLPNSGSSND